MYDVDYRVDERNTASVQTRVIAVQTHNNNDIHLRNINNSNVSMSPT